MTDGFGLIAFASLTPILFVLLYGIVLRMDLIREALCSSWTARKDIAADRGVPVRVPAVCHRAGACRTSGRSWSAFVFVTVGLGLFLVGLEQSLFPLGRLMAQQLTDPEFLQQVSGHIAGTLVWQDFYWVYLFAAAIGFSTTLAEPALMAVSIKANEVSAGAIGVWGLRVAVALGVGLRRRPRLLSNYYRPAAAVFHCGRLPGRHRANRDGAENDRAAGL